MKENTLPLLLLISACLPAHAEGIDLRCEELSGKIIERLSNEGLLVNADNGKQRARAISLELCSGAQASAQQQHEEDKRQTLKNWLLESTGGKAGNKRLRNLKR